MGKLFVFDFHGVLERGTEDTVVYISNRALEERGYPQRLTYQDCERMYGQLWWKYFEELLPHEGHETHLAIQQRAMQISESEPDLIRRFIRSNDYAHFVLDEITSSGHSPVVISNSQPGVMSIFIDAVNMNDYFQGDNVIAVGAHDHAGRSKKSAFAEFMKGKKYDGIVITGDSPGDMDLKSVAGGTTYLYSHPGKPFRDCEADYRIRDLRELLKEI